MYVCVYVYMCVCSLHISRILYISQITFHSAQLTLYNVKYIRYIIHFTLSVCTTVYSSVNRCLGLASSLTVGHKCYIKHICEVSS